MFFSPAYSCAENNKALSWLFQLLIIAATKISRFLSFAITSVIKKLQSKNGGNYA